jgi:hypothetical protein
MHHSKPRLEANGAGLEVGIMRPIAWSLYTIAYFCGRHIVC